MNLPKLPFGMIDVDDETKALLESLDEKWFFDGVFYHKAEYVVAFGIKDGVLHVLGHAGKHRQMYFEIRKNTSTGGIEEIAFEPNEPDMFSDFLMIFPGANKRRQQTMNFWKLKSEIVAINKKDIEEKTRNIAIYQLSLEEVECVLGVSLQLVETGKPKKFLEAESEYYLMTEAYKLGADMIVNCQKSSSGTPVKIVKK